MIKFWDKMQDKTKYKSMFAIAKQCFPLLERFKFEHGVAKATTDGKVTWRIRDLPKHLRKHVKRQPRQESRRPNRVWLLPKESLEGAKSLDSVVTIKRAANKVIGRYINFAVKVYTKEVYEYLYGEKDDKDNGG